MRIATWVGSLALASLLLSTSAGAKMYRWVDENGNVHATSRLSDVPPQYRDQTKQGPPSGGLQVMDSSGGGGKAAGRGPASNAGADARKSCFMGAAYERQQAWKSKHMRLQGAVDEAKRKLDDVNRNPDSYAVKSKGKTYSGNVKSVARQNLQRAQTELREFLRDCPRE